jgi:hypothetical protein
MTSPLLVPPHEGAVLYCTARGTHDPCILGDIGLDPHAEWQPARRPAPAFEYRCQVCGRNWRLGARRMRELSEAAATGALHGEVDLSIV